MPNPVSQMGKSRQSGSPPPQQSGPIVYAYHHPPNCLEFLGEGTVNLSGEFCRKEPVLRENA